MKNCLLCLIICLLLISCSHEPPEGIQLLGEASLNEEKAKVEMVLERYVIASEKQDIDLIRNIWAPDSDIIIFGTESSERLTGWSQIQDAFNDQFAQLEQPYLAVRDQVVNVNSTGTTAWFSEIISYSFIRGNKPYNLEGVRFTGVLEKRDSTWYIVQSHLSLPAISE